ncbi:MAG: HD domain-containing protein [gamma proteobacterium symbiont of Taylorina sp.]|nr:HD domain-containing protein [gamma proteobacterium symbiont of Taylorina sp.]
MILVYAFLNTSIVAAIVSLFLYFTASHKFCFVYYFFKINEKYSLKNYYISFLPRHNPSAVFIFNNTGEMTFNNCAAEKNFIDIKTVKDIGINNYQIIIEQNKSELIMFECCQKNYQIDIKGIAEEQLLLAYLTDVTELLELNAAIEETQREVIYAMGEIGETRSKETGSHVKRVALYSETLALLYGLPIKEAELLKMASPMHDIGKVGIPDNILNAPRKLTVDEFEIMKNHAKLGYEMLKSSNKPILQAAATVAHEHHEKFDGNGYPQGLSGENIHIYGRITAVADVFDALGSDRVYKKAWELDDILKLFQNESAKHFDPKLVTLFLDNLDSFLSIRDAYQD